VAGSPFTFTPPAWKPAHRALDDFTRMLKRRVLHVYGRWMVRIRQQARAEVKAKTGKWPQKGSRSQGQLLESVTTKMKWSKKKGFKAWLFYDQREQRLPPYAFWVNDGLRGRPRGQRLTYRDGRTKKHLLGKAKVAKPWGIAARHFIDGPKARMRGESPALAKSTIDDVVRQWNAKHGVANA